MSREIHFKNPFSFNWKYKEFEIRTTNMNGIAPYVELIKYRSSDDKTSPYCYTLAYYQWNEEGGELIFVGDRPFEDIAEIDIQPIWKQLWLACKMFKDWVEKEEDEYYK